MSLCEAGLRSLAYTILTPSSSLMNLMVLNPLAESASTMLAPSNFSFSLNKNKSTFLLEHVNVRLHDKNGEISIENLYGVVEDLVFDKLVVLVFLNVLGVNFGFSFNQQFFVALLNDRFALVIEDQLVLHLLTKGVFYYRWCDCVV